MGEPIQLTQIRQWEAGELYPEHDTFSFGHGFGTALVDSFDRLKADNERLRRDAQSAVLLLQNLGGMLPGSREVVDAALGFLVEPA